MSEQKMSPEELNAESLRLTALIDKRSEAGLKAVAEMSKHPYSLQQMREQVKKQGRAMTQGWVRTAVKKTS